MMVGNEVKIAMAKVTLPIRIQQLTSWEAFIKD